MIELAGLLLGVCLDTGPCSDEYKPFDWQHADFNALLAGDAIGLWPRCGRLCNGAEAVCTLYDVEHFHVTRPMCFDNDTGIGCMKQQTVDLPIAMMRCTNLYSCMPTNAWEKLTNTPDPWNCCQLETL